MKGEKVVKNNKNGLIIAISVIVGILAAVAATLLVIKYFKNKKGALECTDYVFENDFEDEETESEQAEN